MSSPYREPGDRIPDELLDDTEQPLASVVVSGRDGAHGQHGHGGSDGTGAGGDGGRGGDASPAEAGQHAGRIRLELSEGDGIVALRGERVDADGAKEAIQSTIV